MRTITFASFNVGYHRLVEEVETNGFKCHPRGKTCVEIRPFAFTLLNPKSALYTGWSRRLNYRFYVVETLSYIAGWGDDPKHAELLLKVNPNMRPFINDRTGMFDGAYGPRLHDSLLDIENLLSGDMWSRQAVASIWSPGLEISNDVPCTVMLHFYVEGHDIAGYIPSLSMSVYMRSNDLHWGTPYDVPAFCAIQLAMADALKMPIGKYTHHCGSLHYYKKIEDQPEQSPCVIASHLEDWLGPNDPASDGIPHRYGTGPNIYATMIEADLFLSELHLHVITQNKHISLFRSQLENDDMYWKQWGNLLRRRWPVCV
jgi:hypothetical protein